MPRACVCGHQFLQSNWVWLQHKTRIAYRLHPICPRRNCHPVAGVRTRILPRLQGQFHSVNRKCSISRNGNGVAIGRSSESESKWNFQNDANLYCAQCVQNMWIVAITWRYSSRCAALALFDELDNRCLVYFVHMVHQVKSGDSPVYARHAKKLRHTIFLPNERKH